MNARRLASRALTALLIVLCLALLVSGVVWAGDSPWVGALLPLGLVYVIVFVTWLLRRVDQGRR